MLHLMTRKCEKSDVTTFLRCTSISICLKKSFMRASKPFSRSQNVTETSFLLQRSGSFGFAQFSGSRKHSDCSSSLRGKEDGRTRPRCLVLLGNTRCGSRRKQYSTKKQTNQCGNSGDPSCTNHSFDSILINQEMC